MNLQIRTVAEEDIPDWLQAVMTGFLRPPEVSKEDVEYRTAHHDPERTLGVFDAGRCVATFESFPQDLTVPGGARLPSDAVTRVTVSPTHRRRGLLTRMMDKDLRAAKERGDALATLIAAEYPIYGRYGFGPATGFTEWRIDVARARLDPRYAVPEDGGRVDLADGQQVRDLGPKLFDRFRDIVPGSVSRNETWWKRFTGQIRLPSHPWTEPFHAVYRSASGEVQGIVTYTVDDKWEAKLPQNTATVQQLIATTPAAERALWHFVCSVDWVTYVKTGVRAPDDLLPHLLGDPRAAVVHQTADYMWLRPLDIPRMLQARTYPVAGSLVLEVIDSAGLAGGRFLLDAGPEGATCTPTTRPADIVLPVSELAPLYMGDESASRLAALGSIEAGRPSALVTADTLFGTGRRPWCPDMF
ncbi:GNAT family N-acetyltransferase [Streptomyces sp. MST-110588]|uniref:GNAT family N-acetyltransferase n=1 Tax=Streptomyces sp. MST-110588 TaxID=2833628 RepID=UPI001F5CA875|nr:GNAT family N-acetyltransferase [Streptomyces sp. MST-110588]UNO40521.1 GNAT family N-acetyltransferase [Streptomyces sp. MST-110588]